MKLLVTTHGTLGDAVPVLCVAKELRARGHEIVVAASGAIAVLFTRESFLVVRAGPGLDAARAHAHAGLFDDWGPRTRAQMQAAADLEDMPACYRDLFAAGRAHDVDALVAGAPMRAASYAAEDLARPIVVLHTRADLFAAATTPTVPSLLLSSPHFAPVSGVRALGFTAYDGIAQPGWSSPSPELEAFVARHAGSVVAYVPGSTPMATAAEDLRLHIEAAQALDLALVVQRGWSPLEGADADGLLFADALPHAWLFARAAAVIAPGRPGVVARALRAGCPLLVEPRSRDDFYNAKRVRALGAGGALHPRQLSVVGIKRMLAERVLGTTPDRTPFVREDGATRAAEAIPALLA